jgi:hypothetical protein
MFELSKFTCCFFFLLLYAVTGGIPGVGQRKERIFALSVLAHERKQERLICID